MTHDLTTEAFFNTHGCNPVDHPAWARQEALEEEMRSAGVKRFRDQLQANIEAGREASTGSARRLMVNAHEAVANGVREFLDHAGKGAGRKHTAIKFLKDVDADIAAHLALRSLLDTVSQHLKVTNAAVRIATLIEDELFFDAFKEMDADAYKWTRKRVADKTQNAHHRKRVMTAHAKTNKVEWEAWSQETKINVGIKLIEIVVETTGMFELRRQSEGRNMTPLYVMATQPTLEWMMSEDARMEPMSPIYMPTVMPPRPWTTPTKGGYWTGRVRHIKLVKTHNKAYLEDLNSCDLDEVYASVNAMQNTAWAINRPVYEVMTSLWDNQSQLGKLPQADDEEIPAMPEWLTPEMKKEDMTEAQLELFTRKKQERAAVYERNAKAVSKRLQFTRMLNVAERFKDEEEFYFPHQLDFRGRCYAVPLFLHPQANDAARGLLTFAECAAITNQEGADWLAIHGAGLWGVDKCKMQERVQWVLDNEAAILASATDPYDNRFWSDAEKPWQALAFCMEWAGYRREGFAFESSLPIQMDGTCNGLQNFSAMLLDEVGGRAVNLVPSDKPNDIYQTVADLVAETLRQIALDPSDTKTVRAKDGTMKEEPSDAFYARAWLAYGITRKVTKRPVMTLAYGASEFGFRDQVFEDTVSPWKAKAGRSFPFAGTGWAAASFMGNLIWNAVGEVVIAARAAMDWLQKVAKIASAQALPVVWTTPTGLKVMQEYTEAQQKRLELTFQKVRLQLQIDVATKQIDKRKQSSGISPNWVHSMDAAHMQKTVNRCHEAGIRSFSLIHDSYGTHAGNSPALAQYLREEFVAMYGDHDVLAQFRDEIMLMLPEGTELPPVPPKGKLDLLQVLDSAFFFA